MDESLLTQTAIPAVKQEYQNLGLDLAAIQQDYIWQNGGFMLLLALGSAACTVVVGLLAAKAGAGMARDLRQKTFTKVENFSNVEFDKFSTASLITRNTNDVTQIQMVVILMIRMVIYAPIMGVGGVFYGTQQERIHVVDHRACGHCAARLYRLDLCDRDAQIQEDAVSCGPAKPCHA